MALLVWFVGTIICIYSWSRWVSRSIWIKGISWIIGSVLLTDYILVDFAKSYGPNSIVPDWVGVLFLSKFFAAFWLPAFAFARGLDISALRVRTWHGL